MNKSSSTQLGIFTYLFLFVAIIMLTVTQVDFLTHLINDQTSILSFKIQNRKINLNVIQQVL
jgi:hypothetical protein